MKRGEIKPGQDVTLVSRGIRHSQYSPDWIDQWEIGEANFVKVTKVGHDYVYGRPVWIDAGIRKEYQGPQENKYAMSEFIILPGIHTDLHDAYLKYRAAMGEHDQLKDRTRREFENEAREYVEGKMDEWNRANPWPTPINLDDVEKAAEVQKHL